MIEKGFNTIFSENREATKEEKFYLFKEFVDRSASDKTIQVLFDANALNRKLAEAIYDHYTKIGWIEKGFLVRKIVAVVGISKSSMYRYRPGKGELL